MEVDLAGFGVDRSLGAFCPSVRFVVLGHVVPKACRFGARALQADPRLNFPWRAAVGRLCHDAHDQLISLISARLTFPSPAGHSSPIKSSHGMGVVCLYAGDNPRPWRDSRSPEGAVYLIVRSFTASDRRALLFKTARRHVVLQPAVACADILPFAQRARMVRLDRRLVRLSLSAP